MKEDTKFEIIREGFSKSYMDRFEAEAFSNSVYPSINDGNIYTVQVKRQEEPVDFYYLPESKMITRISWKICQVQSLHIQVPEYKEYLTSQSKSFWERLHYLFNPKSF